MVCGFYCNRIDEQGCNSSIFAVVMLHSFSVSYTFSSTLFPAQVVWSANRDRPVGENATLQLSEEGGLVLRDADGTLVWSTNTTDKSVAGMRITEAGKLELVDDRNVSLWDSFDYPTDSWLLGQALREGQRLTAGQYYLNIVNGGFEAYIASNPPQVYFAYTVHAPKSSYLVFKNGSLSYFAENITSNQYFIGLHSSSPLQFIRLESNGHFRHYRWAVEPLDGWKLLDEVFNFDLQQDDCAYPTVCGEYGLCSNGECTCPDFDYFRQVDPRRLSLGCDPVTPLSCESIDNHRLLSLSDVSYFSYKDPNAAVLQSVSEEQCKQACLRNCSCKGAFFKFTLDSSNGSCYLQSKIYSMMNIPERSLYNSSAYIKVHHRKSIEIAMLLGVNSAIVFTAALVIGCIVYKTKKKIRLERENEDNLELISGLPTRFSFEDLNVATENFSRKLGEGGFGSVFEGILNGEKVAVKRLDGVGQGIKEFLAEVNTIGNIHHINLVRLIGFCSVKSSRLLVYEYMPNGSLDKWIFNNNHDNTLDWKTRTRIIMDMAKGLLYLHEDCRQRIAHLDVKPQNILLDERFHAKVSDFGLAKLIDRDQSHVWTTMRGTRGYLAPEWLTSKITEKADVYSFGVVVMEILCGRKNLDYSQNEEHIHLISLLQDKAKENRLLDIVENCGYDMEFHKDEIVEMMKLAMWCLQSDSNRRPSMAVVVKTLEGSVNVETNIDYNFTYGTHSTLVPENGEDIGASTDPSASLLSGGR